MVRELSTLFSENSTKASSLRLMDSAIQTSPEKSSSDLRQERESTPRACKSCSCEAQQQVVVPPQEPSVRKKKKKKKLTLRGYRRCRRRLLPSQRKGRRLPDENTQPLINCNKPMSVSNVSAPCYELSGPNNESGRDSVKPLKRKRIVSAAVKRIITPATCWSPGSSSSQYTTAGIECILDRESEKSETNTPVENNGFWQLFETDSF